MKKIILLYCTNVLAVSLWGQWQRQHLTIPYTGFVSRIEITDANTAWGSISTNASSSGTRNFIRTTNGGTTWRFDTLATAPESYRIGNLWPIDADTCYAAMYGLQGGSGIYKTTDGGTSWIQLDNTMFSQPASFLNGVYFWDARHGVAYGDPAGPGELRHEIWITNDWGATWSRVPVENIPVPVDNAEYGRLLYDASADGHFFFATIYGNIYRTKDKGHTWEKLPSGLPSYTTSSGAREDINHFAFTDSLHGVAIQHNTTRTLIVNTSDGGNTWNEITPEGKLYLTDLKPVPGTGILVSAGSSTDGFGSSFSPDNGLTWYTFDHSSHTSVAFLDAETGFSGHFANTNSPFSMWKFSGNFEVIPCGDPSVTPGTLTVNKEGSFCRNDTVLVNIQGAVPPTDGLVHGLITIVTTRDLAGSTDIFGDGFLSATRLLLNGADASTFFIASAPGRYYFTPAVFGNGSLTSNNNITFNPENCTSVGVSTMIVVDSTCTAGLSTVPAATRMLIYPQPAGETATLVFDTPSAEDMRISLLDLTGRIVYSERTRCNAGVTRYELRTGELPPGMYVVSVSGGTVQGSSRLVKQ